MANGEADRFLDAVLTCLMRPDTTVDGTVRAGQAPDWPLSPATYLEFARNDYEAGGAHGWINALNNAKRALHCQVDLVLYALVLWERAETEQWRFPRKLEVLAEAGIVTPNTLRRLNKARNEVEHEYAVPQGPEELETFIDTAELFIAATRHFAAPSYDLMEFACADQDPLEWISISPDPGSSRATVRGAPSAFNRRGLEVAATHPSFVRMMISAVAIIQRDAW